MKVRLTFPDAVQTIAVSHLSYGQYGYDPKNDRTYLRTFDGAMCIECFALSSRFTQERLNSFGGDEKLPQVQRIPPGTIITITVE